MRVILVHPGHVLSTAWIYDGYYDALKDMGVEVQDVRLDKLLAFSHELVSSKRELFDGDQGGTLQSWKMHVGQQLAVPRIMECMVDGGEVMLNICGKLWSMQNLSLIGLLPIPKVVLFTESPYEDDSQIQQLLYYNSCFTNDRSSLELLDGVRPTAYLRHAYDPEVFMPVELPIKFDYSFIGTPFGNRRSILKALASTPSLTGYIFDRTTDDEGSVMFVPQAAAARVYNQTKVNLNIHRTERYYGNGEHIDAAYSLGPRAFEIAGCAAFQLCDNNRPELAEVFGDTVATYDQPEEVPELVRYWADDARAARRLEMARASYEIALRNTYAVRARQLVGQLAVWYNRPEWKESVNG